MSDILSLIGSIFSGITGVASNVSSAQLQADATEYAADVSKQISDDNIAYQKEYNQQIFDREDSSYQRAVADAQAAGLSPLVAAGVSAGQSGGVTSAPQASDNSASIRMQGYQGVAQAVQGLGQIASQAALTQSQANLNNANAEKARKETDNIDFEQGFKMSQLTQQQREHIDNMAHNEAVLEQTNRLAKESADLQRALQRAKLDFDKIQNMEDRELKEKLANMDEATKLKIIRITAQTEQATLRIANALNKDRDAAAQQLAYDLENKRWDTTHWFEDAPKWIQSAKPLLDFIVKVGELMLK